MSFDPMNVPCNSNSNMVDNTSIDGGSDNGFFDDNLDGINGGDNDRNIALLLGCNETRLDRTYDGVLDGFSDGKVDCSEGVVQRLSKSKTVIRLNIGYRFDIAVN